MARQAFKPTEALRERVKTLAAVGIPQDDIATIVGCASKTLRKHFSKELAVASLEANAAVAGFLFQNARAGNVAAQIFWLKTRARWKESAVIEHTGGGGRPIAFHSARERIEKRLQQMAENMKYVRSLSEPSRETD